MDTSGVTNFYHIRIHCTENMHPEYSNMIDSLSDLFVITSEGGHYCKRKHRYVRPHLHIYLWWGGSHADLRREIKASCPELAGNGAMSIKAVRSPNLLSYILKNNKVVHKHGYTMEYLGNVPEWVDPNEYFKTKLYAHIKKRRETVEGNQIHNNYKTGQPVFGHYNYSARECWRDIAVFCKKEDRWLNKKEYINIAFHLDIINVFEYLDELKIKT